MKQFIFLILSFAVSFFAVDNLHAKNATHAYLSIPALKKMVATSWGYELKKYNSIITEALARETTHEGTHHVFYHAQKSHFYVFQDFTKAIYSLLYPENSVDNFHFLRTWYNFPKTTDVNIFIDDQEDGFPKDWNDNKPYLSKHMLSVNFSLFGSTQNFGHFGECTFKYFFSNKSIKSPHVLSLFDDLFNHFGFDKKYILQLETLHDKIDTDEGLLFQIFVPHHLVDQIAFAAQRLGTPYRNELLLPNLFDSKKKRYPTLTPILDIYCNEPHIIKEYLDRLQGRLLFSQDVLLNPLSGVKIFRYTTLNDTQVDLMTKKINKYAKKAFKKWIKNILSQKKKLVGPFTYERIYWLAHYHKIIDGGGIL